MATEEKPEGRSSSSSTSSRSSNELSRDPADQHPGEVPSAPLTEHGETSGLKPLVDDLHDRRAKIKLGGGAEKIAGPARARAS